MNKHIDVSNDNAIIESALKILEKRISYCTGAEAMTSPGSCKDYVKLHLAHYPHEIFACIWLDNKNRVIRFNKLFRGTIDGASVYPREVVKAALKHNAAACILVHNHPSGVAEPSTADEQITKRLTEALALIEVRVLDHLICGETVVSFAERGLL